MRLNQFLASTLHISRRASDTLIKGGKIRVNGNKGELFHQVEPEDQVEIAHENSWQSLTKNTIQTTILFYKPIFTLTSRKGEKGKRTIFDALPRQFAHLKPAGRLDYMSEGLLILSTDGDLIQRLTHPSFSHSKSYLVGLKEALPKEAINLFSRGATLEGYQLNPVIVEKPDIKDYSYLKPENHFHWYKFTLTEGRNQQIRRMCLAIDRPVKRLIRIQQGEYVLTKELYLKKYLQVDQE